MEKETTSLHVACYAGHTYPQRPVSFTWQEIDYPITRIIADQHTPQGKTFTVLTEKGGIFTLLYHSEENQWHLNPGTVKST